MAEHNDTEAFDGKDAPFEQCPVFAPDRGIVLGRQCQLAAGHAGQHVDWGNHRWSDAPVTGTEQGPRCGYAGPGPAQLPGCVRHRGHTGQHDHAGVITDPCDHVFTGGGFAKTQHRCTLRARHGGQHRQDPDGKLQATATSAYRSDGVRIIRDGSTVALAVNESEAQRLVGGTAADPLWKADAEAARRQARFYLGKMDADNGRRLRQDARARAYGEQINRINGVLGRPIATDPAAWTFPALVSEIERLISNYASGQRAVRQVQTTLAEIRENARVENETLWREIQRLGESRDQLEEMRAKRDQIYERLPYLRMNSECPVLQPLDASGDVTTAALRKCVRVNGHSGAHIRMDGAAW